MFCQKKILERKLKGEKEESEAESDEEGSDVSDPELDTSDEEGSDSETDPELKTSESEGEEEDEDDEERGANGDVAMEAASTENKNESDSEDDDLFEVRPEPKQGGALPSQVLLHLTSLHLHTHQHLTALQMPAKGKTTELPTGNGVKYDVTELEKDRSEFVNKVTRCERTHPHVPGLTCDFCAGGLTDEGIGCPGQRKRAIASKNQTHC